MGREIAGWEGIVWFGQGWRELGGGHALPDTEKTKELLRVLPLLISQAAKLPGFSDRLHQGFAAALHSLVQSLQFLNRAIAGPFPKTVGGLGYVLLSPNLTPKSSHISSRKHSIATGIFLRNPGWTSL